MPSPARSSAFGMASIGAMPVRAGSTPTDAHARTVASGASPRAAARSADATHTAAAPSLSPAELPAVMEKPSISGWSGGSAAIFSSVLDRRGCSSTAQTRVSPALVTVMGTISSTKRPSSMAATARWWER